MNGWELSTRGRKLGLDVSIGVLDQFYQSQVRIHLGGDLADKLNWVTGIYLNIEVGKGSNEGKIRLSVGDKEKGHLLSRDLNKHCVRICWGNYPKEWTRDSVSMTRVEKIVGEDYLILDIPERIWKINDN